MKTKQYNIKVFEIEIEQESDAIAFLERNSILLKDSLLYIKGTLTPKIENLLKAKGLSYTTNIPYQKSKSASFTKRGGMRIVDNMVRSGQEIVASEDVLLLKRINSGARVVTDGNCIALAEVDGRVECNGDFLLLKPSSKAQVFFKGVNITKELEEGYFFEVKFKNNEIEIIKHQKEFSWA